MHDRQAPATPLPAGDLADHPAESISATEPSISRREFVQRANALVLGLSAGSYLTLLGQDARALSPVPVRTGPREVREVENVWIPMPDGVKLAARLWLPVDAEQHPVPAIFDYIPYRKRDNTRTTDDTRMPYLASFGYACVRPDIRGSGDSEGLPLDEYVKQEQDDGLEIIAWLAKQPWCTGKVGQYGHSWGGFSALQVAARQPPALKAIITHCSTDDRYTDDAHYEGGCILDHMFMWGVSHTTNGTQPPDPAIVGDRWRQMWMERLDNLDFYVGNWLEHQHRDAFWKQGSVDEDYSRIKCAVYAIGGWADGYNCTIPRMLANLRCPRKGLIGPWGHYYPNEGDPGPAIDWLTEALRWWDYWLKDIDTGIMNEPMYRVWMQNEAPTVGKHRVFGRWVAENEWPSPRIKPRHYYLTDGGIGPHANVEVAKVLEPSQTVGISTARWLAHNPVEAQTDQRIDDARSLTFDSEPLKESIEILGAPFVTLDFAVDKPVAFLAVRLNEVQPTGESTRVTYGLLNLTQRDSREFPSALEPGKRYRVRIQLRDRAHVFAAGKRLRIAISTAYWPLVWPSPEAVILTLYAGKCELELPVRPPWTQDARLNPFGEPFVPETPGSTIIEAYTEGPKVIQWDVPTRTVTEFLWRDGDRVRRRLNATGTELLSGRKLIYSVRDDDPTSATLETHSVRGFMRDEWNARTEAMLRMTATAREFILVGEIRAFEHDREVFAKVWNRKIQRMLV